MSRRKLREALADALAQVLRGHQLTIPNAMRYCTVDVRASFNIRRETLIKLADWQQAIEIAKARQSQPIKHVLKTVSTPAQPHFVKDWKAPLRKRLHQLNLAPLDLETRLRFLDEADSRTGYFNKIRAWRSGLLEIVSH